MNIKLGDYNQLRVPKEVDFGVYLDGYDVEWMKGKKILIVDDVISTGASLAALETEGGSDGVEDAYEFAYELQTSGPVRVLGQTGVQRSSMTYCDVTDSVYLELWEKAIARWEEVITVGAEDIDYPYTVDGELVSIDDIFLYFGFSDSYSSESSLGSALNSGYYRDGGQGLAATGSLVFNAKYFVASPSEQGQNVFYNVALQEIAAHAV